MRFRIEVRKAGEADSWWEPYERDLEDSSAAAAWGAALVDTFNGSLRPGESAREFIRAEVLDEAEQEHTWEKTNLVTIVKGDSMYDEMRCTRCEVTGKRFGLTPGVRLDSQFGAAGYRRCDLAQTLMARRRARAAR